MKKTPILLFLLAFFQTAITQITFQKKIVKDGSGFLATSFCEMPDGGFAIGGLVGEVIKLNAAGDLEWAVRADSSFGVFDIAAALDGSIFYTALVDVSPFTAYQLVIKLNANGEKLWDKAVAGSPGTFYRFLAPAPDNGIVGTYVKSLEGSQYTKFSPDGEIEWASMLEPASSGHLQAIVGLSDGGFLLGGYFWNAGPAGFLVKTAADGIPIWGKSLTNLSVENVAEFPTGELLASGNSTISKAIVLVKMTAQGDVIWSKAVDNEGFSVTGNAVVTAAGDIILRTILKGNLTGLIQLDANGNLKWARGYPAGNYQFDSPIATKDGGVALLISTLTADSASHSALLKTTADGTLPGCESVDLCVNFIDFPTQAANHPWSVSSIRHDTTFEATIFPIQVAIADTCVLFVPPDPAFQIPDTICAGNSVTPSGLDQASAGSWNWTFEGGSPDTSTQQTPGEIFFNEPGTFQLQQTVTFGGCPDSFAANLTVLPSPPVSLGPDTLLCQDDSYLLDGSTPGATSYLWENGTSEAQREVNANGVYTLLVSNGLCERSDSVDVRFFDETYLGAFLDLGPDTTLCESDSTSLEAIAPGATEFLWDDGSTAPFHPVTQSGTYSATAFFEHCPLFDEVEIMLIDCRGKIYIPNAFSPNNDGFNDEFKPYGKDVLLKNLKIFDRWGGLLFETNQPELGWDGTRLGKPASAGVYVYLLEYVDTFNGQKELASGEVHLIR